MNGYRKKALNYKAKARRADTLSVSRGSRDVQEKASGKSSNKTTSAPTALGRAQNAESAQRACQLSDL